MMNSGRALVAGVVGGVVKAAITWRARTFMDVPMNLALMHGTLLVQTPGATPWPLGLGCT